MVNICKNNRSVTPTAGPRSGANLTGNLSKGGHSIHGDEKPVCDNL